jgi:hypothetical protein
MQSSCVLVLADLGGRAVGEARVPAPRHALRRRQLSGPLALEEEDGLGERLPVVVRGGAAVLADGVAGELQRRRDEEREHGEATDASHWPLAPSLTASSALELTTTVPLARCF